MQILLERRSIRRFLPKPIHREKIERIVRAAQRAPTTCGMQAYSFILIEDAKIREEIYGAIGKQRCMQEAPVWIMVCVDFQRQYRFFEHLGLRIEFGEVSKLLSGVVDACLAAENMVIAAESLGIGSVFIGSVWAAPKRLAEILKLPKDAMPVLLLCLGYPDITPPPLRPRWPLEAVLHTNQYVSVGEETVSKYYDSGNRALAEMKYFRKGVENWREHYGKKFRRDETSRWEKELRSALSELGFLPSNAS